MAWATRRNRPGSVTPLAFRRARALKSAPGRPKTRKCRATAALIGLSGSPARFENSPHGPAPSPGPPRSKDGRRQGLMNFFSKLRIGSRLGLAFAIVVALTVVSAAFGQFQLQQVKQLARELVAEQAE